MNNKFSEISEARLPTGENVKFYKRGNFWCCPICGNPGLDEPPYSVEGYPTYEICICGFEFGYDDDPMACEGALPKTTDNWIRHRKKFVFSINDDKQHQKVINNMKIIGIEA